MIAYWDRGLEWMGDGLQLAICPSFTGPTQLTALDVSGRSNHGTLTNMDRNTSWVTSDGKGALLFTVNGNVSIPFTPPTAISISGWFFITASGTNVILSMGGSNTNGGVIATTNAQGVLYYANGYRIQTNTAPVLNKWYHFLLTATSPPNYFAVLYVDGKFVGSSSLAYGFDAFTSWLIGTNQSSSVEQMRGNVDDLRVWNRALSAQENSQLYERGRGGGMLYQPPKRRSVFIPATTTNRRRRILCGGNC